jgi:hypothetical protein
MNVRGTKNTFFQKRTGEVIENKRKDYTASQKRTGNEPKSEAEKLLKTRNCGKNEPETNRKTNRAMLLKIRDREKLCPSRPTPLKILSVPAKRPPKPSPFHSPGGSWLPGRPYPNSIYN